MVTLVILHHGGTTEKDKFGYVSFVGMLTVSLKGLRCRLEGGRIGVAIKFLEFFLYCCVA